MKTAEKLFDEHSFSSNMTRDEFTRALAGHDQELESIIPVTFYAGLGFKERLQMIVEHWQRGIKINHELENELTELKEKL